MTRKVTSNRFDRRKPSLKVLPTLLVLCEDSKSSLSYLNDAVQHYRSSAKIEIAHVGSAPQTIVQEALRRSHQFDEIYCVIDRDTHPRFDEALNAAAVQSKIRMIVSYPCFEYWLLLHFKRTRKPYTTKGNKSAGDAVLSDLRKCEGMDTYEKGGDTNLFLTLLPRLSVPAFKHAAWARRDVFVTGEHNPSTDMDIILQRFDVLGN